MLCDQFFFWYRKIRNL